MSILASLSTLKLISRIIDLLPKLAAAVHNLNQLKVMLLENELHETTSDGFRDGCNFLTAQIQHCSAGPQSQE